MYHESYRRNYKTFAQGLMKVVDEGVLLRGAAANAMKYGMLCASMTNVYDLIKENTYYWLGPSFINRLLGTAGAVGLGMVLSMPFDAIRLRMHLMRPLPNGVLPYTSSWDCSVKMNYFEGNQRFHGNFHCFYSGGQAYYARLFLIAMFSQYLLDYYHAGNNVSEYWQPARFNFQGALDYDIHDPWTDSFNN
jgi:hypothetical protein